MSASPRIGRRTALGLPLLGAAMASGLARPAIGQGAARTLRFVPHANLTSLDPLWSNTLISLNHAYMVCDQLYGLDEGLIPRPQMAEGGAGEAAGHGGAEQGQAERGAPTDTGGCRHGSLRFSRAERW
jgi:hypothetical protein